MTEANDKGLYIGRTDLPLSADGFMQLQQMQALFQSSVAVTQLQLLRSSASTTR